MRKQLDVFCWLLILAAAAPSAHADQGAPHPEKAVYGDASNWPTTAPGEVKLKHFRPFRAVYDRQYTQAAGPGAGEQRQDRLILTADEVGWDGRRAVAITLIDSGAAKYADTNMRSLTMVTAMDDLGMLFEIGPLPGKAKDYYLSRVMDDRILVSIVMTESQELSPQQHPASRPGFGPGSWAMASMALRKGLKINLDPYYSPRANPISQSNYGRVLERKTIQDGSGQQHAAWVVETPGWYGPENPKVLQMYLQPTPPYYLGTETYNHDTGERSRFVWLREAQVMEP